MPLSRRDALLGLAGAALAAPALADAGWRPTQSIRIVAGAAAGGTLDIHTRAAAPALSQILGQAVVVENNGGGGGRVASAAVGRATPDGHTLLVGSGDGLAIADLLFRGREGPLRTKLRPVALTVRASQLLVTHPNSGIKDVAGYVEAVRQRDGALTLALPGHGGIAHLISEMLNKHLGGLRVVHVPYRGGGPATIDVLAGQIDAMIITLPAVTEHVRQGRLIPLAVSTLQRDPVMPDVPTFAETIVPDFDVPSTQGAFLPAGTPDAIVQAWNVAWRHALFEPAVKQRLEGIGFVVDGSTPEAFEASLSNSSERFAAAIAAAGIRAEDA